jgi:hypothetical protein
MAEVTWGWGCQPRHLCIWSNSFRGNVVEHKIKLWTLLSESMIHLKWNVSKESTSFGSFPYNSNMNAGLRTTAQKLDKVQKYFKN